MKKLMAVLSIVFLGGSFLLASNIPRMISFQGRFIEDGVPATGAKNITFRIYSQETGVPAGEPLFTETKTLSLGPGGVFQALIGSNTVGGIVPSVFTGENRWVEVQVGTDILSPRTQLVSVPYAFRAETLQPGATIQGDLSIGGELRVGDGTIHLASVMGGNLPNAITISQLAGQNPPQIRTSLGPPNTMALGPTGGTQLTINAGAGGNLNLNTLSTATVRIGNPLAPDQRIILQTTTTIQGNLNVQGYITGAIPPGVILPYAGAAAPPGFLPCDGSAVSNAVGQFPDLFNVIGNTFGDGGDGAGPLFNLPDLRGRFPLGVDGAAGRVTNADNPDLLGGAVDREMVTLSVTEMPAHDHGSTSAGEHRHNIRNDVTTNIFWGDGGGNSNAFIDAGGFPTMANPMQTTDNGAHTHGTTSSGAGGPHHNLPSYLAVNYIIKD